MNIKERLWNRIRELRKEKKLSQQWLADKTGLHRTYISDIERGVKNVAIENIEKISIALEVDIREFF